MVPLFYKIVRRFYVAHISHRRDHLWWLLLTFACLKSAIRTKCKTCSHLTIETPERRHWRRSTAFIWIIFTSYFYASVANFSWFCWKSNCLFGKIISKTQTLKTRSFLPFNSAITKIWVAISLVQDGIRMGGIFIVSTIS